jgi:protein-disulfide isomerase
MASPKSTFTLGATGLVSGTLIGILLGSGAGFFGKTYYDELTAKRQRQVEALQTSECEASLASTSTAQTVALDGSTIESAHLPADVRSELFEILAQSYTKSRVALEEFAGRYEIVRKTSKSIATQDVPSLTQLLAEQQVSEAEIKSYFDQSRSNYPEGTTVQSVSEEIRNHLKLMRLQKARESALADLQKDNGLNVLLRPPCGPELDLDLSELPRRGNTSKEDQPTLVEIVDYFCAQCRYLHATITAFADENAEKMSLVELVTVTHIDSPQAEFAAGAYCAQSLGSEGFWKYHEAAFQLPETLNASTSSVKAAREHAVQLARESGLDGLKFEKCLESGKGHKILAKTNAMLQRNGIVRFPAYAANQRQLIVPDHPSALKTILARTFLR